MTGFNNPVTAVTATVDAGSATAIGTATGQSVKTLGTPTLSQSSVVEPLATLGPAANVLVPTQSGAYDVSADASLEIVMYDPTFSGPLCIGLEWRDGGPIIDTTFISTMGNQHKVSVPVLGSSLTVNNYSTVRSARYAITGSNRAIPAARSLDGAAPGHLFQATGVAFVAATPFKIPAIDAVQAQYNDTAYNGDVQLHAFATAVGLMQMRWCRPDGTTQVQTVLNVSAANAEIFGRFPHASLARCEWWYRPTASAAAQNVFLDIYPVNG